MICLLQSLTIFRTTPYNLRNPVIFKITEVHSVNNGTETLSHSEPNIWILVPHEVRKSVSLDDFKFKIKNGLHLIVPVDYEENVSSRIYFKRVTLTSFAFASALVRHIPNIYVSKYFDFI